MLFINGSDLGRNLEQRFLSTVARSLVGFLLEWRYTFKVIDHRQGE
jgi:hypothetical protein